MFFLKQWNHWAPPKSHRGLFTYDTRVTWQHHQPCPHHSTLGAGHKNTPLLPLSIDVYLATLRLTVCSVHIRYQEILKRRALYFFLEFGDHFKIYLVHYLTFWEIAEVYWSKNSWFKGRQIGTNSLTWKNDLKHISCTLLMRVTFYNFVETL